MEIDENGVVNPLRVPAVVRGMGRSIFALPALALAFAVLAIVALAVELVRHRGFAPILAGEALVVLYPAAVLWHRRDAARATPDLFRGAVLIAASQIGSTAVRLLSSVAAGVLDADPLSADPVRPALAIALGWTAAGGWWLVARALAAREPIDGAGRRIVAAIIAGCAVATAVAQVAVYVLSPNTDLGTIAIVLMASVPAQVVVARLAWVALTRAGLDPRPASWAAAVGASAQAAGPLLLYVIALALVATHADPLIEAQAIGIAVQTVAFLVAPILFVMAFGLGVGRATRAAPGRASTVRSRR